MSPEFSLPAAALRPSRRGDVEDVGPYPCSTACVRPRDGRFGTSLVGAMLGTKYSDIFVRKFRQKCRRLCNRLCRRLHRSLCLNLNLNLDLDLNPSLFDGLFKPLFETLFRQLFAALFGSMFEPKSGRL